jgi:hypothetical protein
MREPEGFNYLPAEWRAYIIALKGKGASQGVGAPPQDVEVPASSPHWNSGRPSELTPLKAAPEPSGEFVRVHQSAFALMEYLLTQGPTFNIPDNIWIPFVDALSTDEQKG